MLVANCRHEWNRIEKKNRQHFLTTGNKCTMLYQSFQIHHPQKFQSLEKQIIISFMASVMGTIQINWWNQWTVNQWFLLNPIPFSNKIISTVYTKHRWQVWQICRVSHVCTAKLRASCSLKIFFNHATGDYQDLVHPIGGKYILLSSQEGYSFHWELCHLLLFLHSFYKHKIQSHPTGTSTQCVAFWLQPSYLSPPTSELSGPCSDQHNYPMRKLSTCKIQWYPFIFTYCLPGHSSWCWRRQFFEHLRFRLHQFSFFSDWLEKHSWEIPFSKTWQNHLYTQLDEQRHIDTNLVYKISVLVLIL